MFASLFVAELFFGGSVLLSLGAAIGLRRHLASGPNLLVFLSLSLGTFMAVAGTALVKTAGMTVFLPGLVPLVCVLWMLPRGRRSLGVDLPQGTASALAWHAITLAVLVLLLSSVRADGTGTLPIKIPHPDVWNYGHVADTLMDIGVESHMGHQIALSSEFSRPSAYHYFELWLAGILSRLAGTTGTVALAIPVVALLNLLALSAIWALMESSGILTIGSRVLTVLGLLLPAANVTFDVSDAFLWEGKHYGFLLDRLFTSSKVAQIVWILGASALAAIHGFSVLGGCILLLAVPVSSVVAPAALTGSTLLLLLHARRGALIGRPRRWLWLGAPVLVAIGTVAFYGFLGDNHSALVAGPRWADTGVSTRINIFATTLLRLPLALPSVLVSAIVFWRSRGPARRMLQTVFEAALALSIGGAVSVGLLTPYGGPDAWQLSAMPIAAAATLVKLAALACVCDIARGRPAIQRTLAGLLLILAVRTVWLAFVTEQDPTPSPYYRRYSREYLATISKLRLGTPRGGFIVASSEVGDWDLTKPIWSIGPNRLGAYTGVLPGLWSPIRLALSDAEFARDPAGTLAVYRSYRADLLLAEPTLSEGECLNRFVRTQGLSFLVLSPKTILPVELESVIDSTVADSATGERFIVVRTHPFSAGSLPR